MARQATSGPRLTQLAARGKAGGTEWANLLAACAPLLTDLEGIGADATPAPPVLCHNTLGPANARRTAGSLVVLGWEHAGGQPPAWELGDALVHWCLDPDGGVNAAGARALVAGYPIEAGTLPPVEMAMFRGAVASDVNYVSELVEAAPWRRTAVIGGTPTGSSATRCCTCRRAGSSKSCWWRRGRRRSSGSCPGDGLHACRAIRPALVGVKPHTSR